MDTDEGAAETRIATGIRDQLLIIEGWFASHADSGTPGPHVHLRTNDARDAVVRTDQVPDVIEGLVQVAERVGRLWESHGEHYTDEVLRHSPDPNDPQVVRQEEVRSLQFAERASARMPDVVALLTQAESTDEALESIARLLGVDEAEAMVRLAQFDLLSLTRPAQAAQAKRLAALRDGDTSR